MSNAWQSSAPECMRARSMMAEFVDSELDEERLASLLVHLEVCKDCAAALDRFAEVNKVLANLGDRVAAVNGPAAWTPPRLARETGSSEAGPTRTFWLFAVPALAAAALLFVVALKYGGNPSGTKEPGTEPHFIAIPYLAPIDPRENTTVLHMNIRVASLLAAGYKVTADPDLVVPADVLMGEDGRAHAIRLRANVDLKGTEE